MLNGVLYVICESVGDTFTVTVVAPATVPGVAPMFERKAAVPPPSG